VARSSKVQAPIAAQVVSCRLSIRTVVELVS
jgi:hypothetical protein